MIIALIFSHTGTTGAIAWVYIPEVCVDAANGFAGAGMFLTTTLISLTFEFMINSILQVYGSIWYFSGLSFIGFIFVFSMVRETRGLTDLQKKSVYTPKRIMVEPIVTKEIQLEAVIEKVEDL